MATREENLKELARLQRVYLDSLKLQRSAEDAVTAGFAACAAGDGTGASIEEMDASKAARDATDIAYADLQRHFYASVQQ